MQTLINSVAHIPEPLSEALRYHEDATVVVIKLITFFFMASPILFLFFTQFALELRNKVWPSVRQAGVRPHPLGCMDFVPTNCHINLMQVSYPKSTTSAGRTFSIRFGRKNSIFGLDPDQGRSCAQSSNQED